MSARKSKNLTFSDLNEKVAMLEKTLGSGIVTQDMPLEEQITSEPSPWKTKISSFFKNMSVYKIMAIITPILLVILLYAMSPNFVLRKDGDKSVRDRGKIFVWSLFFSILIWGGMFAYKKYKKQA